MLQGQLAPRKTRIPPRVAFSMHGDAQGGAVSFIFLAQTRLIFPGWLPLDWPVGACLRRRRGFGEKGSTGRIPRGIQPEPIFNSALMAAPHSGRRALGQGAEQIRVSGRQRFVHLFQSRRASGANRRRTDSQRLDQGRSTGLQVFGHVVLPHTLDPKTGGAATVLLPGGAYSRVGIWEQLRLDSTPLLLERQVRVLRLQLGPTSIPRRISRSGLAQSVRRPGHDRQQRSTIWNWPASSNRRPARSPRPWPSNGQSIRHYCSALATKCVSTARCCWSTAIRSSHASFPIAASRLRIWAKAGFNAVRLAQPPTPAILAEAEHEGLWLIGPPPLQNVGGANNARMVAPIGPSSSPCSLGIWRRLTSGQLDATVAEIRSSALPTPGVHRPILCAPTPICDRIAGRSTAGTESAPLGHELGVDRLRGMASYSIQPRPSGTPFGLPCKRSFGQSRASSSFLSAAQVPPPKSIANRFAC